MQAHNKMEEDKARAELFYNFLVENKLEKDIIKIEDDLWKYNSYNSHPFIIHNLARSVSSVMSAVYEAGKKDGERYAKEVATLRFVNLFDSPKDNY